VGEVLRANVRRDSLVARLGGDEFGLLLSEASSPYAAAVAIRLCRALASRPIVLRGHPEVSERITLSIGLAGRQAGDGSAGWYARADAARSTGRSEAAATGSRSIATSRPPLGPPEPSAAALPGATNRG
jgi:diguanylate cyclase